MLVIRKDKSGARETAQNGSIVFNTLCVLQVGISLQFRWRLIVFELTTYGNFAEIRKKVWRV
jgi:hypothetical protein